jgi:hypothetical protein
MILFVLLVSIGGQIFAQNRTDISLFSKSDSSVYLNEIRSATGDLFYDLGHHGPAVENEWLGFRFYFDKKAAIDVYSKTKPGLELRKARWYPTVKQQAEGWGADYYKVGATVGLGGIRLWDGQKVVLLNPVSNRVARVEKEGTESFMELLSEDVPYKNTTVDVLVRLTVFSGIRKARVEAFALTDDDVQFVTGINYHKSQKVVKEANYIATWGLHPEDIVANRVELGAAIIYNPDDFEKKLSQYDQYLLVSKPCKHLEYWITSANAKEPELNTIEKFIEAINH